MDNKVEGYNLPQGTMAQWFRSIAGRKPASSPASASIRSSTPALKAVN